MEKIWKFEAVIVAVQFLRITMTDHMQFIIEKLGIILSFIMYVYVYEYTNTYSIW